MALGRGAVVETEFQTVYQFCVVPVALGDADELQMWADHYGRSIWRCPGSPEPSGEVWMTPMLCWSPRERMERSVLLRRTLENREYGDAVVSVSLGQWAGQIRLLVEAMWDRPSTLRPRELAATFRDGLLRIQPGLGSLPIAELPAETLADLFGSGDYVDRDMLLTADDWAHLPRAFAVDTSEFSPRRDVGPAAQAALEITSTPLYPQSSGWTPVAWDIEWPAGAAAQISHDEPGPYLHLEVSEDDFARLAQRFSVGTPASAWETLPESIASTVDLFADLVRHRDARLWDWAVPFSFVERAAQLGDSSVERDHLVDEATDLLRDISSFRLAPPAPNWATRRWRRALDERFTVAAGTANAAVDQFDQDLAGLPAPDQMAARVEEKVNNWVSVQTLIATREAKKAATSTNHMLWVVSAVLGFATVIGLSAAIAAVPQSDAVMQPWTGAVNSTLLLIVLLAIYAIITLVVMRIRPAASARWWAAIAGLALALVSTVMAIRALVSPPALDITWAMIVVTLMASAALLILYSINFSDRSLATWWHMLRRGPRRSSRYTVGS